MTSPSERVAVSNGGGAISLNFVVSRAAWGQAILDDDEAASADGDLGVAGATAGEWTVENLDVLPGEIQERVTNWVSKQEAMWCHVVERVPTQGQRGELSNWGQLPSFAVGDYVVVARVRKLGSTPKLVTTWTDSWRVLQRVRRTCTSWRVSPRAKPRRCTSYKYVRIRTHRWLLGPRSRMYYIRDLQAPGRVRDGRCGRRWQGSGAAGRVLGADCVSWFGG